MIKFCLLIISSNSYLHPYLRAVKCSFLKSICRFKSIYFIVKGDLKRLVCQHNSRHFISLQNCTSYNKFFPFKKIFLPENLKQQRTYMSSEEKQSRTFRELFDTLVFVNDSLNFCVFVWNKKKWSWWRKNLETVKNDWTSLKQ